MYKYCDIIKEGHDDLRRRSEPVALPLQGKDLEVLLAMNEYLQAGYDPELTAEDDIRPGVGLSAVQVDYLKRMFVMMIDDGEELWNYGFINPKIVSHSEALTFLPNGEGCLSVDRDVEGLVMRAARITIEADIYDFATHTTERKRMRLKDFKAIVFQHEFDHLNGVLFIDHINPDNPFDFPENATPLKLNTPEQEEDNDAL